MNDPIKSADGEHPTDIWEAGPLAPVPDDGTTAFPDPELVVDVEHDEVVAEDKPKGKPNYAILAVGVIIAVALLGGVGMFLKSKFIDGPRAGNKEEPLVLESVKPANPDANLFAKSGSNDAAAVAPVVEAASVSTQATAANATPPAPATVAVQPALDAPVAAGTKASAAPVVAAAPAVVATPATVSTASAKPTATVAVVKPVAPAVVAEVKIPEINVEKAEEAPAAKHVAKKRHVTRKATAKVAKPLAEQAESQDAVEVVVAEVKKAGRRVARTRNHPAKDLKPVDTTPDEKTETVLLPKGLKVRSVYPPAGDDAQAWLVDAAGRTEIVHAGDTLRSGAQVTKVIAESGEVVTTSGVITSKGVR